MNSFPIRPLFVVALLAACAPDEPNDTGDTDDTGDTGDTDDTGDTGTATPVDPTVGAFASDYGWPGFHGESAARVHDILRWDGRLVVGGIFQYVGGAPIDNLAVLGDSGWEALGGGRPWFVYDLAVDADGVLWGVGWEPDDMGGFLTGRVQTWDGTTWTDVGGAIDGQVRTIEHLADGRIVIGGDFTTVNGVSAHAVALLGEGGWSQFPSTNPDDLAWASVNEVFPWGDYEVCAAGAIYGIGEDPAAGVVCVEPMIGWKPIGQALTGEVFDVATLVDGTTVAVGSFVMPAGRDGDKQIAGIAHWDAGKGEWIPAPEKGIDGGLVNIVREIHPLPNGGYAIAGLFQGVGAYLWEGAELNTTHVARYDGTWHAYGDALTDTIGPYAADAGGGYRLFPDGDDLWVGGLFHRADGKMAVGLAAWDGEAWRPGAPAPDVRGLEGESHDVALLPDGTVIVVGAFDHVGPLPVANVARRAPEGDWEAVPGSPEGFFADAWVDDDTVWIAGDFSFDGGANHVALATLKGDAWTPVVSGLDGGLREIAVAPDGTMYVAGDFTQGAVRGVARVGAQGLEALGGSLDGPADQIAVDDAGHLYVAGMFDAAGGTSTGGLAKWDGTAWSKLGDGLDGWIWDLAWFDGKLIVAGGSLQAPGASDVWPLAAWDGAVFAEFGSFTSTNEWGEPMTFAVEAWRGGLYVSGGFDHVGEKPANMLAWTADGTTWKEVGGGVDDLTMRIVGGEDAIWFAGPYRRAGEHASHGIARLDLP